MFTIKKIEGTTVTVVFDKYKKQLQLPNAPVDSKDALLQFCSDRERAYCASREMVESPDMLALVGKVQATLPPLPEPEPEVIDESTNA